MDEGVHAIKSYFSLIITPGGRLTRRHHRPHFTDEATVAQSTYVCHLGSGTRPSLWQKHLKGDHGFFLSGSLATGSEHADLESHVHGNK